jgi:hypothetical protein
MKKFKEAEAKAKIGKTVRLLQPILVQTGNVFPAGTIGQVVEVTSVEDGLPYRLVVRWDAPGEHFSYFDKKITSFLWKNWI